MDRVWLLGLKGALHVAIIIGVEIWRAGHHKQQ
jgi:hypothetical protein